jgi:hypothetical protein
VQLLDEGVKWNESDLFRYQRQRLPELVRPALDRRCRLAGLHQESRWRIVEHFDVFLGGALGSDARFNRRIKRLSAEEVAPCHSEADGCLSGKSPGR